jgi:hypothetical protein
MKPTTALVLTVACFLSASSSAAERVPLLQVSKGQLPNDTAQDNQTKFSFEESHKELGGKALKVVYAAGDAFGMSRGASVRNWKPFVAVEFSAFNPASQEVPLTFTVRHRRTTSYQTRVDMPIVLKPGRNNVRLGIDEMVNVNGSTPDLSDVQHWYFACASGQTPTLYFGDFWLTGGEAAPPAASSQVIGGTSRVSGAYRIRGKIGDQEVDLTITPEDDKAPAAAQRSGNSPRIKTDPARLARIRGAKMPGITRPVLFHTPEADAILAALEIFPPDNAFNQVIEDWPLHPNSRNIVASIGLDKPFRYNPDMGFVLVPPNQPRVEVKLVEYPGESDAGPFPVPDNIPIEGWPAWHQRENAQPSLADVQRRPEKYAGDRHAIVVDPVNRMLYEFFTFGKTSSGWAAGQASVFNLKTNALRPDGWTSADAAGLPIFPAVVRYDEIQRGLVEHAMRVTVRRTRRAYVAPATHFASRLDDENLPRMGERLRLRADFNLAGFSPPVQAILKGLKKYGMFVADNGIDWAISVTPDPRIPVLHEELRKIKGTDFEIVVAPE